MHAGNSSASPPTLASKGRHLSQNSLFHPPTTLVDLLHYQVFESIPSVQYCGKLKNLNNKELTQRLSLLFYPKQEGGVFY